MKPELHHFVLRRARVGLYCKGMRRGQISPSATDQATSPSLTSLRSTAQRLRVRARCTWATCELCPPCFCCTCPPGASGVCAACRGSGERQSFGAARGLLVQRQHPVLCSSVLSAVKLWVTKPRCSACLCVTGCFWFGKHGGSCLLEPSELLTARSACRSAL